MQAKGFANWPDATDAYGFSALPGGYYNDGNYPYFFYIGEGVEFWSATEDRGNFAYTWALFVRTAYCGYNGKQLGAAVRCLQD